MLPCLSKFDNTKKFHRAFLESKAPRAVIKDAFSRLYCCYGNLFCHKNKIKCSPLKGQRFDTKTVTSSSGYDDLSKTVLNNNNILNTISSPCQAVHFLYRNYAPRAVVHRTCILDLNRILHSLLRMRNFPSLLARILP